MLQEALHEFKSGQCCGFPQSGLTVFMPEGYESIFKLFDAVVGNSDPLDVGGQVF